MTPDDLRLTVRLVAAGRIHSVSDDAVMAMARRVLELESDAEEHAANVRLVEREACAKLCEKRGEEGFMLEAHLRMAAAIRARGGQ